MKITNYKANEILDISIQVKEINKTYSAFLATITRTKNDVSNIEYVEGIQKNNYLSYCLKNTKIPESLTGFYKSEELLGFIKKIGFSFLFSDYFINKKSKINERVNLILNGNRVTFNSVDKETVKDIIVVDYNFQQLQNVNTGYIYNSAIDLELMGINLGNYHKIEKIKKYFINNGRVFQSEEYNEFFMVNFSDEEYQLILEELKIKNGTVLSVDGWELPSIIIKHDLLGINQYLK